MNDQNKAQVKPKGHPNPQDAATLTDPRGMGGIVGGDGYDFQTRYIITKIPEWLTDIHFSHLFHEGTGDVDVRFGATAFHIQLKDHTVKVAEFRDVVSTFVAFDKSKPGEYSRFILACPGVDSKLNPLKRELKRVRDANPFYANGKTALRQEVANLQKRINSLGLSEHLKFLLGKVFFEDAGQQFHDDEASRTIFIGRLQTFRDYSRQLSSALTPCYDAFFTLVSSNRAKVVDRVRLEQTVEYTIRETTQKPLDVIYLDVHNWILEKYEPQAHYTLDWTNHFDRTNRKIPSGTVCNGTLLPELQTLAKSLAAGSPSRIVRFRGKCCLSVGVALGAVFSEPAGWVFEIQQPQMLSAWRSNCAKSTTYPVKISETALNPAADSIAYIFSISGHGFSEAQDFLHQSSIGAKALIVVEPVAGPGGLSIANGEEAVSLALVARDYLNKALSKYKVRQTHLFFYGPLGLAIFIGQKMTSLGDILLYEYQSPGYVKTFCLKT